MVSRIAVGALVLLAAAGLLAQTTQPAQAPYTGVVAGKGVYVRSGAGVAYYPCAKLSFPTQVRVVGAKDGWAKILPPRVCFSLISKDYVRVDGEAGIVTGTNVRVRAGSSILPHPFHLLLKLPKIAALVLGELSQIVSEACSFRARLHKLALKQNQ